MSRKNRMRQQARTSGTPQQAAPETEELEDPLDALSGDGGLVDEVEDEFAEDPSKAPAEDDPLAALQKQFEAIQAEKKAAEDRLKAKEADEVRFKSEADTQRAAREDAEKRLRDEQKRREQAEEHRFKAEKETLVGQKSVLEHAIAASKADVDFAKRNYAEAMTNMDYAAAAEAQEKLAEAKYKVERLNEGYSRLQEQIDAPAPAKVATPEPERRTDPAPRVDEWEAAIASYSEGDKQWLRAHRADLESNPQRAQLAQAADTAAVVRHGLQRGTTDYYEFLDDFMGYSEPEGTEADPEPSVQKPVQRPRAAIVPAAPPTRANPQNGSSTQAYLTPIEKQTARDLGMSFAKYASWKEKIAKGETHLRFTHEGN